ncbi:hypothetical protein Gogos_021426 [Gossypium gossypioides]|uniref:Reverse transcriptase zinc-binding domain-containing protein n=1 Tax=Gossypium gossypioides TaxID=34282 RepID=A0A7J9D2Q1_GOSGO|nr:hypothetical protein [Gossypium gossypioides]
MKMTLELTLNMLTIRNSTKKLWLLNLPSKIKITIWKISWNFLSTRVNMLLRKLTNTTIYPRCGVGIENMDHLFRECPVSISVWKELSCQAFLQENHLEFVQWLTWVFLKNSAP